MKQNKETNEVNIFKKIKIIILIILMLIPFLFSGFLLIAIFGFTLFEVIITFIAWFGALFALFYVRNLILSGKIKLNKSLPFLSKWWDNLSS